VQRKILGPKRDEVTGDWRRLHNDELNDLYPPNITRLVKSRKMGWAGYVALMGYRRGADRFLVGRRVVNGGVTSRILNVEIGWW
jgi:hypothetical protein